jgi:hypothetical protein
MSRLRLKVAAAVSQRFSNSRLLASGGFFIVRPYQHMDSSSLTGQEALIGFEFRNPTPQILDYWRWAFSDLTDNVSRGVFAEWMLARILNIPLPGIRDTWCAWDLKTVAGIKIQVKASSYVQAWHTPEDLNTNPVYKGLKCKGWLGRGNEYTEKAGYFADLYVFCLYTGKDIRDAQPLDVTRWRFYLLDQQTLVLLDQKSISLSRLQKLTRELTAEELKAEIAQREQQLAQR